MMDDLISRQAAIQEVHKGIYDFFDMVEDDDESPMTYLDEKLLEVNKAITNRLRALLSAQPERKRGKWIDNKGLYQCSVCKHIWSELWWVESCPIDRMNKIMHYCPDCGAEMVKGEEDVR